MGTEGKSYFHNASHIPHLPCSVADLFDASASKSPDKSAFIFYQDLGKWQSLSFRELQEQSVALARGLIDLGCNKGDCVGISMPNSAAFPVVQLALHRLGAKVFFMRRTIVDCEYFIDRYNLAGLFVDLGQDPDGPSKNMVNGVAEKLKFIITLNSKPNVRDNVLTLAECVSIGKQLDSRAVFDRQADVLMDDAAYVIFTSGSTGVPKGIEQTVHSLVNNIYHTHRCFEMTPDSTILVDRSMGYAAGLSIGTGAMLLGRTLVCCPSDLHMKDSTKAMRIFLDAFSRHSVTHWLLIQAHLHDMADYIAENGFKRGRLQVGIVSGQPFSKEMSDKFAHTFCGLKLLNVYGSTETNFIAASTVSDFDEGEVNASVGRPIPHHEIKITDTNNILVPFGTIGEIKVRGFSTLFKYIDQEKATGAQRANTGWFSTGDLGSMNKQGCVTVNGRKCDMFKHGIKKVYPVYVESILGTYPEVQQVVVVGVPHERLFNEICACLVVDTSRDGQFNEREFLEWCKDKFPAELDGLSVAPQKVVYLERIPMGETGKTDRAATRTLALKMLGIQS